MSSPITNYHFAIILGIPKIWDSKWPLSGTSESQGTVIAASAPAAPKKTDKRSSTLKDANGG